MKVKDLQENIDKLHTTKLGEIRIEKNIGLNKGQAMEWCKKGIIEADLIIENGKNWYVYYQGSAITVNGHSLTVITAHKINGKIRVMEPSDFPCLGEFLYQGIFVPQGENPPLRSVINEPEINIYLKDFGQKPGDIGVVAEQNGQIIGAAWTRIIRGFGFIDENTPELVISIFPEFRGLGTGTKLLKKLFKLLKDRGYEQTSLSLDRRNPALSLYKKLGYKIIERKTDTEQKDYLMLKTL